MNYSVNSDQTKAQIILNLFKHEHAKKKQRYLSTDLFNTGNNKRDGSIYDYKTEKDRVKMDLVLRRRKKQGEEMMSMWVVEGD